MAGLKEIRTRIASVKSTRQITSAMKMVAAARLRKSQNRILKLRPYAEKLGDILHGLVDNLEGEMDNLYMKNRDPEKVLIILVTSNRGLCGAFNANVIKSALKLAHETYGKQLEQGKVSFYAIGKKGAEYLEFKGYPLKETNVDLFNQDFAAVATLAETLMNSFKQKEFDRIELVYNQFKNAAVQNLITEHFLPLSLKEKTRSISEKHFDYIFEPNQISLVNELIPKALKIQLFKMLLDSFASEQGARMTAMHQATDNATELISELTLHYNKARQSVITKEILDIVGGAEALS